VLCAPDYTRTCTCAYPIQTSVALVPDAEAEMWTFARTDTAVKDPIKRVGINLGAPGDRVADDGTLWIEHPSVGGKSPKVEIKVETWEKDAKYVRRHASQVTGPMPWVAASGIANLKTMKIEVNGDDKAPAAYTVRLYFAQPAPAAAGLFVADVKLQGKVVEPALDVVKTAGGADRSIVREYRGVRAGKVIEIGLVPGTGKVVPVLSGVELVREAVPAFK